MIRRLTAWMCRHGLHIMSHAERSGTMVFHTPGGAYAGEVPWAEGPCRWCGTTVRDEDWGDR